MTGPQADEAATRRPGGPPPWFLVLAAGSLLVGAILVGLSALGVTGVAPGPDPTLGPSGEAAQRTWSQVASALGQAGFQVQEPQSPYRPGESPALQDVPRKVLQAIVPSEPGGAAYVVVYELPSNAAADRTGRDFLRYLRSGTGAVQYPRDARFVLQRVGPTLAFFAYSPEANPDPRLADLATALGRVGEAVAP